MLSVDVSGIESGAWLSDLLEQLVEVRRKQWPRLQRIHDAMLPTVSRLRSVIDVPVDTPDRLKQVASYSEINYLPLVEQAYAQVLKVDGITSEHTVRDPWEHWQRNRLDAGQSALHQATLRFGHSAALVERDQVHGASVRCFDPREVTVLVDSWSGSEWPIAAMRVHGNRVQVWDNWHTWILGSDDKAPAAPSGGIPSNLKALAEMEHGFNVCPVVPFRDSLADDASAGLVERLLPLQASLNHTEWQLNYSAFFTAFQQLVVSGFIPKNEQEKLRSNAGQIWYLSEPDAKAYTLPPGSLQGWLDKKASTLRDMASLSQLPIQNLGLDGVSNVSAEALSGMEAAKTRRVQQIQTSLGESWEQVFRLCAHAIGDTVAAADHTAEVRWKDTSAVSFASLVDGLVKLVQVGLPPKLAFEQVPGFSDQQLQRIGHETSTDRARALIDAARQAKAEKDEQAKKPSPDVKAVDES